MAKRRSKTPNPTNPPSLGLVAWFRPGEQAKVEHVLSAARECADHGGEGALAS